MKIIKTIASVILSYVLIFGQSAVLAQSTAAILPQGKTQFLDNNGNPLSSGKVYFYVPSTTTFKTTWQDAAKTTPNTNPVILDAGGRAIIYGDGTYRQRVTTSNNNLIYDTVTASAGTGGGTTGTGDGDLVGTVKPWAGLVAPNQYAFAYGQEVSRTTYSVLFTALTSTQTVGCTSGSPTLTGLSDTSQFPVGAIIETSCLAPGTTVLSKTSTTVTVSVNSSLTASASAVFFLYGNGNGSTTFNLPDLRGYVVAGRCNMGGTSCSNLTTAGLGETPNATGASGGASTRTLITGNLPPYTPAGTVASVTPTGTVSTSINDTRTWGFTRALLNNVASGGTDGATGQVGATSIAVGVTGGTISASSSFTGAALPTQAFTGTAQGGTSSPISIIQPTITLNYIIKITPDSNSADASGVTSLGGMTGDIACGSGLLCTGNTISSLSSQIIPNVFTISASCDLTGIIDCTTYVQAAVDACESSTGGIVLLPGGKINLNSGVQINSSCSIFGQPIQVFADPVTGAIGQYGTYIAQTLIAGSPPANSAFTVNFASNGVQFKNLGFIQEHPVNGIGWAPKAYAPVVLNKSASTLFQNIGLLGVYEGFRFGIVGVVGSGNVTMDNLEVACFSICINVVRAADIIKLSNLYGNSYIVGSANNYITAYLLANSVIYKSARSDTPYIDTFFAFNVLRGIYLTSNADGYTSRLNGVNISCDHCQTAIYVDGASTTATFSNLNLNASSVLTEIPNSRGIICTTSCYLQINNATLENYEQSSIVALAVNATMDIENVRTINCNVSNAGWPPIYSDTGAIVTVSGGFNIQGGFCSSATPLGPGTLNVYNAGASTTTTFTNKTFDTAGTGNVFRIGGNAITGLTGSGNTLALSVTPTFTSPTIGSGGMILNGSTSGALTLKATPIAGSGTLNLPSGNDTLVGKATTDILTNKTINSASGVNTIQFNGQTVNNYSGSGLTMLLATNPEIAGSLRFEGSSSGITLLQAAATASGTLTLPSTTGIIAVTQNIGTIRYSITGVNFNSANTDNAITITLPTGITRYSITRIMISNASASISTATIGVFTSTGGGGQTIAANQAITVTATAADTNNNTMQLALTNANTMAYNDTTLQVRVGTAQGSAATADVIVYIYPHT